MPITSSVPRRPGTLRAGRLLTAGVAGCSLAVLAACSSSSSASPAASASATPPTVAQLKKIVLQPAEAPSGWKAAASQPDQNTAAEDAALVACIGGRNTNGDQVAKVSSDDFGLSNATISSNAASFRSPSDVAADTALLHSAKASACYSQLAKKQIASSLPAGAKVESASIKITPGSSGGPANVIATGTGNVKIQAAGQQLTAYLNAAFITGPSTEAEVDAVNVGSPVPASVVNPLVTAVATRAARG